MAIGEAPPLNEALLSIGAKLLCSAVFVSGRDPEEALPASVHPRTGRRTIARYEIDEAGIVRTYGSDDAIGVARFCGSQGAVIVPADDEQTRFEPVRLESELPPAADVDWPLGDRDLGEGVGVPAELQDAFDAAFTPDAQTAALLVCHRGRVVAERYALGAGPETELESWSMGKSLTATLVGLLAGERKLELDEPAPIEAWQQDARRAITVRHLLQMSSGLRCSFPGDPTPSEPGVRRPENRPATPWTPSEPGVRRPENRPATPWTPGVPDHVRIYTEPMDVFAFAIDRELEHAPGTVGRYRNCDPLVLGYLVRELVGGGGAGYLGFPQRALFDRIGIRKQTLECDMYGNFIMTGFDFGTARNWARLGLLYLGDGVFAGERVLPEGWSEVVSTPAPAWERPEYGGLFWLNRTGDWPLPEDAYAMSGDGNQRCFVVPSLDLVVVRLGHVAGEAASADALNEALRSIVEVVA